MVLDADTLSNLPKYIDTLLHLFYSHPFYKQVMHNYVRRSKILPVTYIQTGKRSTVYCFQSKGYVTIAHWCTPKVATKCGNLINISCKLPTSPTLMTAPSGVIAILVSLYTCIYLVNTWGTLHVQSYLIIKQVEASTLTEHLLHTGDINSNVRVTLYSKILYNIILLSVIIS